MELPDSSSAEGEKKLRRASHTVRLAVPTDVPTTYRFGGESLARAGTRNREHTLALVSECKRRRRPGLTQPRLAVSKVCTTSVERAQEIAAKSGGLPLGRSVALASVGESPSRGRGRSEVSTHASQRFTVVSAAVATRPPGRGLSIGFGRCRGHVTGEVSASVSAGVEAKL